jgi:hypothetical protein
MSHTLTKEEQELVQQLKKEVAHIVEVGKCYTSVCDAPGHAQKHKQNRVQQFSKADKSFVQNDAALRVFCNEHAYVRHLRARQW